jgi:protease-4
VVYVEGAIIDGMGDDGISVGGKEIAKRIREVSNDDNFKGLVLRVNSPGGSVSGSDAILSEITRIKEKGIPVIVSMGAVAASGGNWISMDSDKIFAGEQTITGSIGVFGLIPNLKKMAEGFGIHWDVVKTHASADIMSVSRAKSDLELEVVQNHVERIYDRFLNLVSENRDLNVTRISEIAQGRVWMGVDAYELGLVDEFNCILKTT